ncbi:MAG: hypothetical protein ACOYIT_06520 [Christensenellales bacterium]|jgi:hypothetical protein
MNKTALMLTVMFFLALVCNSLAQPVSNTIIRTAYAGLSSNKYALFNILTKIYCEKLGIKSYSLYKSDGSLIKRQSVSDFVSGRKYSLSINLESSISSGSGYYIVANFVADEETKAVVSETISLVL